MVAQSTMASRGLCFGGSAFFMLVGLVSLFQKPTGELYVTTSAREVRAFKGEMAEVKKIEQSLDEAMASAD